MSTPVLHLSESILVTETKMHEVMTPAPRTIPSDASIVEAHSLMRAMRCRHLPVVDDGVLVGVVSERDLFFVQSLAGDACDRVSDAMNPRVYTTKPEARLRDVARVMAAEKYGSAIVMDGGRIAGIFTSTDAFKHLVAALP
jgi:acetoin utilization protein AcuB